MPDTNSKAVDTAVVVAGGVGGGFAARYANRKSVGALLAKAAPELLNVDAMAKLKEGSPEEVVSNTFIHVKTVLEDSAQKLKESGVAGKVRSAALNNPKTAIALGAVAGAAVALGVEKSLVGTSHTGQIEAGRSQSGNVSR